MNRFCLAPMRE